LPQTEFFRDPEREKYKGPRFGDGKKNVTGAEMFMKGSTSY
jgi:hypothetical protein